MSTSSPRAARLPAIFFAAAALLLLAGDVVGEAFWGARPVPALWLLAAALVAALAGLLLWRAPEPSAAGPARGKGSRRLLGVMLLVHLVTAVVTSRMNPARDIDTWTFQTTSAERLLHGIDPYGSTHPNPYSPDETRRYYAPGMVRDGRVLEGLQYPPLDLLWVVPGYLLGDVRYSFILAVLLAAVLLYAVVPGRAGLAIAIFFLVNPYVYFVENRCWTEPLVFLLVLLTVWTAQRRSRWLPVALGLLLAAKQYDLLAVPLATALLPAQPPAQPPVRVLRLLGGAVAVAALTLLPFAVWNGPALWHDLVLFHLAQPARADALSLAVRLPGAPWPGRVGAGALLALLGWAAVRVRGPVHFGAAFGLAVFLFFVTGKQAFTNYFFLAMQCFTLAAACTLVPTQSPGTGSQQSGM